MTIHISGGSGGTIKQFEADPGYAVIDKTRVKSRLLWVLYTPAGGGPTTTGMPMGLLLALTYATTGAGGGGATYQLSVNTTGGIQRIAL
jgi:hypothetical protein